MRQHFNHGSAVDKSYHGKILQENYSKILKQHISENIRRFQSFEETLTPVIPYLSAWHEDENAMWYEFVGKRFVDLMDSPVFDLPDTFRKRIKERRIYNYLEKHNGHIVTQTIKQEDINDSRQGLRQEGERKGFIEAVYKVLLPDNSFVWLKDQAIVKTFKEDKINISSGCLTIVTKEMEAEEELLKTQNILKNNVKELKIAKKREEENAARLTDALKQIESARKEAEKANKAKSEFLTIISHEIRNPMHGIISTCDLITADEFSRQQHEYLGIIKNSAVSLLGLINDILDFSKIEAGKLDFQESEFNLRDVIEDVSDIMHELTSKKNIELVVDIDPDVPVKLVSDPMRLRQIVINLAFNALKFTEDGEIIIRVELSSLDKSHVELLFHVRDTGIGIAPEHIDSLFDSFTQVNDPVSMEHGGSGLGLAICRQIVEMMGGSIWVESVPGRGSTFFFKAVFKYIRPEKNDMLHIKEAFNQYRVLIAEGNKSSQVALERLLHSWGFNVTLCSSSQQAIEKIDAKGFSDQFELIIMDMGLEGLDNAKVSNKLKSIAASTSLFIAISSMGGKDGSRQALEIGIKNCLVKPVKQLLLLETIKKGFGYSADSDKTQNTAAPLDKKFSGSCILFVEDNAINRKIGLHMLQMAGVEADTARHGIEAVEKVQNKAYAAMFIDLQMPHLDGIEASTIIRQQFSRDQLPIIAMSAYSKSAKWEACLEAGINDYILKPISKDMLFKVLDKHLSYISRTPAPALESREFEKADIATENADMENRELENLPGIDIREGIDRLGGVRSVFITLLNEFCEEYASFQERLKNCVAKGDFKNAATLAHSIKGAAGNLSANRLFEAAKTLEQACWDQREDKIIKLLEQGQSAFQQVCDSAALLSVLKKEDKNKEKAEIEAIVSVDDILTMMKSLMNSLEKFDPVLSESLVMEIKPLVGDAAKTEMDQLIHDVKNYQFDDALHILGTIVKKVEDK